MQFAFAQAFSRLRTLRAQVRTRRSQTVGAATVVELWISAAESHSSSPATPGPLPEPTEKHSSAFSG